MNPNKKEYEKYVEKKTPNSPLLKNVCLAYLVGGLICVLGQGLMELYKLAGLSEDNVKIAVPVTLVFLGAFFTGVGLYDKLAKYAGAGTIVPITGFANSIVSPAMEFKSEGIVLGVGAKMFTVAGPVIVFGTIASVLYGVIRLFIFGL